MSAKQKAVEDIKKLGKMLSGMIEAADDLEMLGSIENAIKESEERLNQARAKEALAKASMDDAVSKLDEAKSEAALVLSKANLKAEEICAQAAIKYDQKIEECAAKLRKMDLDAAKNADRLAGEEALKRSELSALCIEIESKSEQLKNLKAQLEAIKAKVF
jgi:DNA repair exonuclease SbcCD ATPase subunit